MHAWKIALRYIVGLALTVVIAPIFLFWYMWPWSMLADFVNIDARISTFWGQAHPPLTFFVGFIFVVMYYSFTALILFRVIKMVRSRRA